MPKASWFARTLGTGVAIRAILKELREIRLVLQAGVDTMRHGYGLPPIYTEIPPVEATGPVTPREVRRSAIVPAGDFHTFWCLAELAREAGIADPEDLDLEALGLARGWIDMDGVLLVLPQAATGLETR